MNYIIKKAEVQEHRFLFDSMTSVDIPAGQLCFFVNPQCVINVFDMAIDC